MIYFAFSSAVCSHEVCKRWSYRCKMWIFVFVVGTELEPSRIKAKSNQKNYRFSNNTTEYDQLYHQRLRSKCWLSEEFRIGVIVVRFGSNFNLYITMYSEFLDVKTTQIFLCSCNWHYFPSLKCVPNYNCCLESQIMTVLGI